MITGKKNRFFYAEDDKLKIIIILDWYSNNKLDLNWSKSFFMFKRRVLALGESLDSFGVVNRRQAREIIKKQLVC